MSLDEVTARRLEKQGLTEADLQAFSSARDREVLERGFEYAREKFQQAYRQSMNDAGKQISRLMDQLERSDARIAELERQCEQHEQCLQSLRRVRQ